MYLILNTSHQEALVSEDYNKIYISVSSPQSCLQSSGCMCVASRKLGFSSAFSMSEVFKKLSWLLILRLGGKVLKALFSRVDKILFVRILKWRH